LYLQPLLLIVNLLQLRSDDKNDAYLRKRGAAPSAVGEGGGYETNAYLHVRGIVWSSGVGVEHSYLEVLMT
jgi:hypothetical protein